jgi:hypothetical protein
MKFKFVLVQILSSDLGLFEKIMYYQGAKKLMYFEVSSTEIANRNARSKVVFTHAICKVFSVKISYRKVFFGPNMAHDR